MTTGHPTILRLSRLKSRLAYLGHGLLDLLYPPRCLVCGAGGGLGTLCESCAASFTPIPAPTCPVCGRPLEGENCRTCATQEDSTGLSWGFDSACAAGIYVGPLRHAIHRLKYEQKELLGEPLGTFLANRLVVDRLLENAASIQAVAYVPMHPGRERTRGYNQARLLAEPVAAMLGVPLLTKHALVRARKFPPQVGLSPNMRRQNVTAESFAVPDKSFVQGKHLLLIDDVFTTGTTVSSCAAALKAAGAATVTVTTLAAGD